MRVDEGSWAGEKISFDHQLVEIAPKWCVYAKFYVERSGWSHPLVVGKSGSLNVNAGGCDLNFSMNPNDGPARQFLVKNRLKWNHYWVLVKGVKTERKAYALESAIQRKYGYYGS